MTAPRMISADEAEALYRHGTDEELAAIAPDLATSVVALHAEVERLTAVVQDAHADFADDARVIDHSARRYERIRIADWLRGKSRIGLAEEGLDETARAVLYALIAYANAIDANRMDE